MDREAHRQVNVQQPTPKIAIIVLAQHESLLQPCLSSIILRTSGDYGLIVVNDGDQPGIQEWLQNESKTKLLTTAERVGVAAGFNLGAAAAGEVDLLVFVRDHAVVTEGWLDRLRGCMERHGDAAMVGPFSNGVNGLQRQNIPESNLDAAIELANLRIGQSQKVTRLLSYTLMVRREAFEELGRFDEQFGLEAYEDDDLCYRALRHGYGLYIALDCFVRYSLPPSLIPEDPSWFSKQLDTNRALFVDKWGVDAAEVLYGWKWPVTVSLCMIVKNEEKTLDACLSSVKGIVDEIVIVDTGSTDRTKEIAARYTDRVYDYHWIDDFAAARNVAFGFATKDYILWLDADDVLLPEDAAKCGELVREMKWDVDAVSMVYNYAFDEQGQVTTSLRRNRLVKRSNYFRWIGPVHEYLEVYGNIVNSDIIVTHTRKHSNSTRNLNIFVRREQQGESFTPRDLYYYANELSENGQWERAAEKYEQYLQHGNGWLEDVLGSCSRLSECYYQLKRMDLAKRYALQAFTYAPPRAEHCCRLGYYFMEAGEYATAAYWYNAATQLERPSTMGTFQLSCWTYLPHLQLCVCYDKMGNREMALKHHRLAASYTPEHPSVLANEAYFASFV
jgi:glycosyltransferase involved in cell wall biosynthesis